MLHFVNMVRRQMPCDDRTSCYGQISSIFDHFHRPYCNVLLSWQFLLLVCTFDKTRKGKCANIFFACEQVYQERKNYIKVIWSEVIR